jgi:hypothetical protein
MACFEKLKKWHPNITIYHAIHHNFTTIYHYKLAQNVL